MAETLKLMAILAHPDDESLGFGGILAKCAAEHIETTLVTATLGERGWTGDEREYPGPDELGRIRKEELRAAARALGIQNLNLLGYIDGELDQAPPAEIVAKIVEQLRRVRPQVVVTFGPDGCYGHPDHIAISQFATAAIVEAASSESVHSRDLAPHSVAKLYYMAPTSDMLEVFQSVFGELVMHIAGDEGERRPVGWPEWQITTRIDASRQWRTVWNAVLSHQTQIPPPHVLEGVSEDQHQILWGTPTYYRVFSLVNGGRSVEDDVFAGLRSQG